MMIMTTFALRRELSIREVRWKKNVTKWSVVDGTGRVIMGGLSKEGAARNRNYLAKLIQEAYDEGRRETTG